MSVPLAQASRCEGGQTVEDTTSAWIVAAEKGKWMGIPFMAPVSVLSGVPLCLWSLPLSRTLPLVPLAPISKVGAPQGKVPLYFCDNSR